MSSCAECGAGTEPGQKFCGECGSPLARGCPACGTPNPPARKFCGECGAALTEAAAAAAVRETPAVERRLVSVLFADLVGFTSLSESRDAEDTRALLSRYFEACERLVSLYGGTVEKFIGDAVMALWGAPVAQEDDAERAVRTALDLVAAVEALGEELDAPALRARVGVLTGEAAVTLGAQGQGMVAGDLVNTASRVQSVAEPGSVLVGETTKRATEAAIAYESAGTFELKGKAEPASLFRALRVTAARGGALKSAGLEPPFVGRDRELRLVKELFHASTAERKAHLVSIVGIAGIGKSRLAWEFEKYVDGLADTMFWWRGRCLAYGEGVAFWALAEMIRTRADIVEGEEPQSARRKLREGIEPYIADPEELAWIEPRLAHLLGLEADAAYERQDLFGAWRLYFERLSEHQPIVLVFEDLQWADASLLEFIEHLLDWSRAFPIFVLTLARPDLTDHSPGWGAGGRNFSSLFLEPLSEDAMEAMLGAFVPGLPSGLRAQIMARAEGVPLYAVETVRMLLDRGLLEEVGGAYSPTGTIEALDVPETLHALVAARLDGLGPTERRLLQDASVLGKTFTRDAVAALDVAAEGIDELLQALVRKEVLSLQLDPRSPERGQYGFLQDLLRQVAYETLPKRERKARHLAAAAHLERTFGGAEQEVVEVIASHHLAAYEADPEAEDAPVLRERASSLLAEAARRSASLGAAPEAQRYFDEAAALAAGPLVEAELLEQAGVMAWRAARAADARTRFERAVELLEQEGDVRAAARVTGWIGQVDIGENRHAEAIERMERAFAALASEPDESLAALAQELARAHALHGSLDAATERVETAIEIAEARGLPEVLAEALNTKGTVLLFRSRVHEGIALQQYALRLALEHDLPTAAIRAYNNVGQLLAALDRHEEAIETQERGIVLARRVGARLWEELLTAGLTTQLTTVGRWDEAVALAEKLDLAGDEALDEARTEALMVARVLVERGELERAHALADAWIGAAPSEDTQVRVMHGVVRGGLQLAEGDASAALASAEDALAMHEELGWLQPFLPYAFATAVDAAFALGDDARAESLITLVDDLAPGRRNPSLEAHRLRLRARLNASRGETAGIDRLFATAERIYDDHRLRFWLAVAQLEHAEWLIGEGRHVDAEPLLARAQAAFAELGATPWLERVPVAV